MIATLILPLPVRPVVQDTTPALLARGLERVFGDIPVVTEEVVSVHLVVDLVGTGSLGPLDLRRLVHRLLVDDGSSFGDAEEVFEEETPRLGGIHWRCCKSTHREEERQYGGEKKHCHGFGSGEVEVEDGGRSGWKKKGREGRDDGAYILTLGVMLKDLRHRD